MKLGSTVNVKNFILVNVWSSHIGSRRSFLQSYLELNLFSDPESKALKPTEGRKLILFRFKPFSFSSVLEIFSRLWLSLRLF